MEASQLWGTKTHREAFLKGVVYNNKVDQWPEVTGYEPEVTGFEPEVTGNNPEMVKYRVSRQVWNSQNGRGGRDVG